MKRNLYVIILVLVLSLSACVPVYEDPGDDVIDTAYTEEELIGIIEELLPEAETNTTYTLEEFESSVKSMIGDIHDGVVGIVNESSLGYGTGSGVVYKHIDNMYYVVTNEHVVAEYDTLTIVYERNGLLFEVVNDNINILGMDPVTDLAVLTFTSSEEFPVIPLADSYDVEIGQFAFAIGNPLGFEYYGTVTMGVISGLARYVQNGDFDATLLQHDAAISPGNSGGALVNINGELIGINNMKLVTDNVSNIGFAIPSNTVARIIEDLEDDGIITRPYLGISTYAQVNACGLDYGVCATIAPGGAADEAGLEDGDVIIGYKTADMDDFLYIYNFNDLKEAILNSSVGDTVILKYIRNGSEYISDSATLNVHPDDQ
ncbi:MAG: trypsin-like peptidase domain-containing protein [Candidatus Izemoplasma sp.]|nr:trypsin-like peptidase domain-containing protein [Candidatus Izemoplasma sp.]